MQSPNEIKEQCYQRDKKKLMADIDDWLQGELGDAFTVARIALLVANFIGEWPND